MRNVVLILCLLITACDQKPAAAIAKETASDKSMAGQSIAGKAHYDKACANCHEGKLQKAPYREMIGLMTPEAILGTITDGIMRNEAAKFTQHEKIEIAEYLGGEPFGRNISQLNQCETGIRFNIDTPALVSNWGLRPDNSRFISEDTSRLSSSTVTSLKPKWAIAFPSASRVRSQPTFAGDLI